MRTYVLVSAEAQLYVSRVVAALQKIAKRRGGAANEDRPSLLILR